MRLVFPPTIRAVFTDLDGTLTDGKGVQASTIDALWRLREKGFWVVVVTGRSAGWADALMRLWPIDAAIFENGAGYFFRRQTSVELVGLASTDNTKAHRARLLELFEQAQREVPQVRLAHDQPYRLFDFAINTHEQDPHLSASEIQTVLRILRSEPGVVALPSSTHINFLFGHHTKRTGTESLLRDHGQARGIDASQIVFVGDSLNDEPLFEFLEHSVGVANIADCWEKLKSRPKQTTKSRCGKGFEEVAFSLLTP